MRWERIIEDNKCNERVKRIENDAENMAENAINRVENNAKKPLKNSIKCNEKCKQFVLINGQKLAFYFYGKGENVLVFLHGWGANSDAWRFVANAFCDSFKVVIVDFYGFGDSDFPSENYGVKEYAKDILSLLEILNIDKVTFVGHSFGGRVGIEICAKYPQSANKLVLVDSAGVKPRRSFKYYVKVAMHKTLRKIGLKGLKGSGDFSALQNNMKAVFKRIVNYHQNDILKDIKCQTAIFWGDEDKQTPMYMYNYLLKNIENSYGFMLNGGHFAYAEDSKKFLAILKAFLQG